jgi:hypothetical protein
MGRVVIQDMPSLRPLQTNATTGAPVLPDQAQQAEFTRQLEVLVTNTRTTPASEHG